MFSSLIRKLFPSKPDPPKPTLSAETVSLLKCGECRNKYEEWDGFIHESNFIFLDNLGKVFGQVVLYCSTCKMIHKYPLTESGLAKHPWRFPLDYIPPEECLVEEVTYDHILNLFKPEMEPIDLEVKVFLKAIKDGDRIWFFSSDEESWKSLVGRQGYVIKRDDKLISAIVTLMN